jgi:hypothetical protein
MDIQSNLPLVTDTPTASNVGTNQSVGITPTNQTTTTGVLIRKGTVGDGRDDVVLWNPAEGLGTRDPYILGQKFTNLSFIFFDKPETLKGSPLLGFVKIRGAHDTDKAAVDDGHRIISKVESKYKILTAPTGAWLPLTESNFVVIDEYDVKMKDDELHLRDKAMKEKDAVDQRKITELKEEEQKFKDAKDIYEDEDSLDFYTLKRVTEMKLSEQYDVSLRELKKVESKLEEIRGTCFNLDTRHPEYRTGWIDNYNVSRERVGIPNFVSNDVTDYDLYIKRKEGESESLETPENLISKKSH